MDGDGRVNLADARVAQVVGGLMAAAQERGPGVLAVSDGVTQDERALVIAELTVLEPEEAS